MIGVIHTLNLIAIKTDMMVTTEIVNIVRQEKMKTIIL